MWIRQAAEQGYAPAQNTLGLMYHSGRGVLKNSIEAYKWYELAVTHDGEFASFVRLTQKLKEHLGQRMTLAQINEGQRRARKFLATLEENQKASRGSIKMVTE